MQRYKTPRLHYSNLATLILLSFAARVSLAQAPVPPPEKVWVSLGYSTLDQRPPDWKWLRSQCEKGKLVTNLQPIRSKVAGLLVPVFDEGRAFYPTSVRAFKGGNSAPSETERALRSLLAEAKKVRLPVYLGVDVLGWDKSSPPTPTGKQESEKEKPAPRRKPPAPKSSGPSTVFGKDGEMQELNDQFTCSAGPEGTTYASPFDEQVRVSMTAAMKEIAERFPEAAGVALDLRLSSREILGYSIGAREASIIAVQVDPIDLLFSSSGDKCMEEAVQAWTDWRRQTMETFVKVMVDSYRSQKKDGQVLLSGFADYYFKGNMSHLWSSQDWLSWTTSGLADGLLLEGRWLPPQNEAPFFSQSTDLVLKPQIVEKLGKGIPVVPVAIGSRDAKGVSYQKEWNALKSRKLDLKEVMVVVRTDEELKGAVEFASGEGL